MRAALVLVVVVGCGRSAPPSAMLDASPPASSIDLALAEVDRVHGGHGPWAVAGYRMGRYAIDKLGLPRQSFDLEIEHRSPLSPQYACVADGASAATGASLGKLNLRLVEATPDALLTIYRRKSTGVKLSLRPTAKFADRFKDVPVTNLAEAGRTAMGLLDAEIFEEIP